MFLKIASWVAGNVMTLFRSAPGSKSAISPDISPVFVSVSIVNSRPMLAPVSVVRCRLQTRAEHLVSKNILICNNSFYFSIFRFETSKYKKDVANGSIKLLVNVFTVNGVQTCETFDTLSCTVLSCRFSHKSCTCISCIHKFCGPLHDAHIAPYSKIFFYIFHI